MKLESLHIEGFRKLKDITIQLGDASFLIGENNVGKTSILRAIELILTNNSVTNNDFSKVVNEHGASNNVCEEIVLTGEFGQVPEEANSWIGFRGRVFIVDGDRKVKYRKTFSNNSVKFEMWEQKRNLKEAVKTGKKVTIESLIASGLDEATVRKHFGGFQDGDNLTTRANLPRLELFYDAWNFEEDFDWVNNPGGIPQNVISKLPKFVLIPAEHKANEIHSDKKTALGEVMSTIFDDIVESSENFEKVKEYFVELESEIDTENEETVFGALMVNVNNTIKNIFPESQILAKVNLSDPGSFLKPKYDIQLGSNIMTDVTYQGTGMIRSTAFSLLKFREDWKKERDDDLRNLIIGFEEPELFLHPNAASQMRETIYELAGSTNQIICTSHSPYMIDLSRENERQIVNNISLNEDTFVRSTPFSITDEFKALQNDDKHYVKMLVKIDDYFARAFFAKKVLIVEGDTEDVVIRKTISILPKEIRNKISADFQFIKARGKATIPPLVRYFNALGIDQYFVLHDRDQGVVKAEEVNPRILEAVGSESNRLMLEECIEDVLGYKAPAKDKPYKAFVQIDGWESFEDLPDQWKNAVKQLFKEYLDEI